MHTTLPTQACCFIFTRTRFVVYNISSRFFCPEILTIGYLLIELVLFMYVATIYGVVVSRCLFYVWYHSFSMKLYVTDAPFIDANILKVSDSCLKNLSGQHFYQFTRFSIPFSLQNTYNTFEVYLLFLSFARLVIHVSVPRSHFIHCMVGWPVIWCPLSWLF